MATQTFDYRFTDGQGIQYWVHARQVEDSEGHGHVEGLCQCMAVRVSAPQTVMVNPASNSSTLHVAVDEPEMAAKVIEMGIAEGLCVPKGH